MGKLEIIKDQILGQLREDFVAKKLSAQNLERGYEGVSMDELKHAHEDTPVEFDLAFSELEKSNLVDTGPMVAHKNTPGSGFFVLGVYSERKYAFLRAAGYKTAIQIGYHLQKKGHASKKVTTEEVHFYGLHTTIIEKCGELFENGSYAEAVEKSFKVVRYRLRELTGYETGSDAFGKGKLHIDGAAAEHVGADFNQGVKFLTMAIDMFRNEKAHTVEGNIYEPTRAHQYLSLSSLALSLLEKAHCG